MKKALVVAAVVLLVVVGVPVLMPGTGGADCADCGPATLAGAMCVAGLAAATFTALVAATRLRLDPMRPRGRLVMSRLDRPPRLRSVH